MTTENQSDRDLLVRVDSDVRHLSKQVSDLSESQVEHENKTDKLAEQMLQLTYNVGHMVKSMEKAEAMMATQATQQAQLASNEAWKVAHEELHKQLSKSQAADIAEVKEAIAEDKKIWAPLADLAGKWKWAIGGGIAIIAFLGWDKFAAVLRFVGTHV